MSTHEVLVVKVKNIFPHPEPATTALEIVKIWDYEFIVRKGDFKLGDLAVVVEPDYVVPVTHDLFKFLDVKGTGKPQRITTKRLRGIWSQGLVVPALPHHKEGQNVIEELGIIRYEPKVNQYHGWGGGQLDSGIMDKEPVIPGTTSIPKYDLENLKKYASTLEEGEQVIYTTKLHGTNSRYVYYDGKYYCGSRTTWKKDPGTIAKTVVVPVKSPPKPNLSEAKTILNKLQLSLLFVVAFVKWMFGPKQTKNDIIVPNNTWHEALKQNEWLRRWLFANPGVVVYGEVIGRKAQGELFTYGFDGDNLGMRVFDILENGKWVNNLSLHTEERFKGLLKVPVLFIGPHNKKKVEELAEMPETFEGAYKGIREGVVVKPVEEKIHPLIGRVCLKYVSNQYLVKS